MNFAGSLDGKRSPMRLLSSIRPDGNSICIRYTPNWNTIATGTNAIAAGIDMAVLPRLGQDVAEQYHLVSSHDVTDKY